MSGKNQQNQNQPDNELSFHIVQLPPWGRNGLRIPAFDPDANAGSHDRYRNDGEHYHQPLGESGILQGNVVVRGGLCGNFHVDVAVIHPADRAQEQVYRNDNGIIADMFVINEFRVAENDHFGIVSGDAGAARSICPLCFSGSSLMPP